ncbi:hypothetical protein YBT020_10390 [Bacillus thuringiensis serovar finitimus YBT-020]|nr:hypothetical protein YBT020_10390 [Bacillus thuringiensis serovar finitimus YBT-020]
MANRISAGAVQTKIKILFSVVLFMPSPQLISTTVRLDDSPLYIVKTNLF